MTGFSSLNHCCLSIGATYFQCERNSFRCLLVTSTLVQHCFNIVCLGNFHQTLYQREDFFNHKHSVICVTGRTYPERIITDLESAREQSLQDVVHVRRGQGRDLICPYTGNDLVALPGSSDLMVPVITRREFKYRTQCPDAKDNPHSAVLAGYRSRKRDEAVAFANKVDFTASTMSECVARMERYEKMADIATL